MPRNQGFYNQPSQPSTRGVHPDMTPDGELRPEAFIYADPEERDFNARFHSDRGFAGHFMDRVAERQRQLPEWIQREVAGQTFGEGRGTYAGITEYDQKLAELDAHEDRYRYGADVTVVPEDEIEPMPMSRYEELFDQAGRPKPGVVIKRTSGRSMRLDDGIDPHSQRELRSR